MSESQPDNQRILNREIEEELKSSYIDYAMSVIVSRTLPDVKDGLKPVQRRILYTMSKLGLLHNKPFRKSATIIGNAMARFHPHGDASIYSALVRMAQDFSLRHPLVDGQGNWGSIDGDRAAAFRYTEARLTKLAEELLVDIDKETVDFVANFDGTSKEPIVLPSKFPNLLVNGSSGIAVGMATDIPPHNMDEVLDVAVQQIDNPEISVDDLVSTLRGPDFPTGGIIMGRSAILKAYKTGRGTIRLRGKVEFEEKKEKEFIIVKEIPYKLEKVKLLERVAELVKNRTIPDISDLRDESDRDGMRIVIELKKNANRDVVLNQLYQHSQLESSITIALVALINGAPKTFNIKKIIQGFLDHRKIVVTKRCEFDLRKASERMHLVEGLIKAIEKIDEVVKTIKSSENSAVAKTSLIQRFELTEKQSTAVLEMRLQKLSSLEQESLRNERSELVKKIEKLREILGSPQRVLQIIKEELAEIKEKYGSSRKTVIEDEDPSYYDRASLISPKETVVTVTHSGYVKTTPLESYKQQNRGGRGIIAASTKEGDFIENLFVANTHSYMLFFTNKGKIHWRMVYDLPEASRSAAGKAIVNLLNLSDNEKVTAFVTVKEFKDDEYLIMATKKGIVKKTDLSAYSRPRTGGIIAITLQPEDELISVRKTDGTKNIILASRNGNAVRFEESSIRITGRSARGVRGMRLVNDQVVGMVVADESKKLLTVCENGFGKRTGVSKYRLTNRGGRGVINIQTTERNGKVVAIASVSDDDELVFISRKGIMLRTLSSRISAFGRNTQGVRLMRVKDDSVVACARIAK